MNTKEEMAMQNYGGRIKNDFEGFVNPCVKFWLDIDKHISPLTEKLIEKFIVKTKKYYVKI